MSGPCESVSASSSRSLPRRRTSRNVAPSSALSGGSNVLSALSPGVITDSIRSPGSAAASRRATISISGSSGTSVHVSLRRAWTRGSSRRRRRSAVVRRASWRRSSPSRRPPATSTARTSARRCARRCCPTRRPSSACRAPRPTTPRTSWRGCTAPAARRVLLVGHIDTVVAHAQHKPLTRVGEQLVGSGTVDMKGGVILSIGALRAFAKRPELLRRDRAAARLRRGVADGGLRARRAVRGLRRLPVLRGR